MCFSPVFFSVWKSSWLSCHYFSVFHKKLLINAWKSHPSLTKMFLPSIVESQAWKSLPPKFRMISWYNQLILKTIKFVLSLAARGAVLVWCNIFKVCTTNTGFIKRKYINTHLHMYACMWCLLSFFFLLGDYIIFEYIYAHLLFGLESIVSKKLYIATSGLLLNFSHASWEVKTHSTTS